MAMGQKRFTLVNIQALAFQRLEGWGFLIAKKVLLQSVLTRATLGGYLGCHAFSKPPGGSLISSQRPHFNLSMWDRKNYQNTALAGDKQFAPGPVDSKIRRVLQFVSWVFFV